MWLSITMFVFLLTSFDCLAYAFEFCVVFISAAVAVSYMFLLVFSWVYLGDLLTIPIPFSSHRMTLLKPYTSLKWLMGVYFVIFVTAFIIFIVGTYMLGLSSFCAVTAPLLFKFTTYLVITWWLMFVVIVVYMIKFYFGQDIAAFVNEQTREHTNEEMEERIFRKVFNEFDKNRTGNVLNCV
jgi:hypothetical protein